MYLDTITPAQSSVGYGQLGVAGSLGYEGQQVRVQGRAYAHSLSTHPPARLLYHLDGRYGAFRCQVALNDDAAGQVTHADFVVRADGRQVALVHVAVGEPPHELAADLAGAQTLELAVRTTQWPWCHAVWLEPRLEEAAAAAPARALVDCLGRAEIVLPQRLPQARRCIATVVSHGFEAMLDDMLGSLLANGGCQDALLLVFVLGHSPAAEQVAAKYRALTVRCQPRSQVNAASKAILYSVAHVVDAAHYLCLDADMLVLGDLRPVFVALEACPEGSILACREGNGRGLHSVGHALATAYGGRDGDLARILGSVAGEGDYALVVNDGLFAGGRSALLALDAAIRGMPGAAAWADERRDVWWRNQLVFNLALARLECGVELDATYNVQLHVQDVALTDSGGRLRADWQGRPVPRAALQRRGQAQIWPLEGGLWPGGRAAGGVRARRRLRGFPGGAAALAGPPRPARVGLVLLRHGRWPPRPGQRPGDLSPLRAAALPVAGQRLQPCAGKRHRARGVGGLHRLGRGAPGRWPGGDAGPGRLPGAGWPVAGAAGAAGPLHRVSPRRCAGRHGRGAGGRRALPRRAAGLAAQRRACLGRVRAGAPTGLPRRADPDPRRHLSPRHRRRRAAAHRGGRLWRCSPVDCPGGRRRGRPSGAGGDRESPAGWEAGRAAGRFQPTCAASRRAGPPARQGTGPRGPPCRISAQTAAGSRAGRRAGCSPARSGWPAPSPGAPHLLHHAHPRPRRLRAAGGALFPAPGLPGLRADHR
ncbi:MAG: NPCBM/NEW2 domain-containing protein [Anaerolineae bacterium]